MNTNRVSSVTWQVKWNESTKHPSASNLVVSFENVWKGSRPAKEGVLMEDEPRNLHGYWMQPRALVGWFLQLVVKA